MPIHDWTRVADGTFHHFHVTWIPLLSDTLNKSVLPRGYYAMAEQVAGIVPDVLALQAAEDDEDPSWSEEGGGTALAMSQPKVAITAKIERSIYAAKANRVVIRHQSRDRVVALLEVVSAGNKASRADLDRFVEKAVAALNDGVHLSLIDLHPPTRRDPQGIHGVIWQALGGEEPHQAPIGKPLTLAAYSTFGREGPVEAFVDPLAVGDVLPNMPIFLSYGRHVDLPLEETYMQAVSQIPLRARAPLER